CARLREPPCGESRPGVSGRDFHGAPEVCLAKLREEATNSRRTSHVENHLAENGSSHAHVAANRTIDNQVERDLRALLEHSRIVPTNSCVRLAEGSAGPYREPFVDEERDRVRRSDWCENEMGKFVKVRLSKATVPGQDQFVGHVGFSGGNRSGHGVV